MIWAVLIEAFIIVVLLWLLFKTMKKKNQSTRNVDVLLDHEKTDAKARELQAKVKKKIIEAKNEKDSDSVIRNIRDIYRNAEL